MENVRVFSETKRRLDFDYMNQGHIFENNKSTVTAAILNVTELNAGNLGPAGYIEDFTYRNNDLTGAKAKIRVETPEARERLRNVIGLE